MWLPFMLLALMASGSACPNLCECHQSAGAREHPPFGTVDVRCSARVPGLSEIPAKTRRLTVAGAGEYEVIGLLDELEVTDSFNEFEAIGTLVADSIDEANDTTLGLTEIKPGLPYLEELTVTNCSLVSLNVSWYGLERVRALNLSCNNLARLSDVLVARMMNLSELTCLDLSDNSLTDVSAGAFRTLVGLVRLSLRRNAISAVHEDAFRGLDRLEFLDLSDNRLADLPDSALTPLYSLQKLDLSGNQLQVLGARWFESLDRLRELDVSRNGLARAASGTLQPLPGLSVLKLSENPLKERDVSLLLGTGRRLETVDASRTGLARVPPALTRSVRALRLAGNKLTTIRGGDLDSYPLLRILDISDNRLIDIEDDALGRLEVLEELDISGNLLTKIPGSLPSSLTLLKLERNSITALRLDDLQGLYNLKSLMLNENDIGEIEVGSLGQLPVLVELDLSDNPIKALPANTLSGPSNLARLRMSGLTSLRRKQEEQSDMTFPVPTPERLVTLDVSRSPALARQLLADDAALSACKSLAELNLSETNITSLRFDLPYMLPQLRVLGLSGNDWNCTEDLYWLGEWIRQHEESNREVRPGHCATPDELSGSFLNELPLPPDPPSTSTTSSTARNTVDWLASSIVLSATRGMPDSSKPNVSSTIDSINTTGVTNGATETTPPAAETTTGNPVSAKTEREIGNLTNSDETRTETVTTAADVSPIPSASDVARYYEAPTSFRNVTSPVAVVKVRDPGWKNGKSAERVAPNKYSIKSGTASRRASEGKASSVAGTEADSYRRTFDNRVDGERSNSDRANKAAESVSKLGSAKPSKLERPQPRESERKTKAEKYSKSKLNNLTKENLVLADPPGSNTIAEELNSRASDSGARVSEALSAGAHPGMLVLAGAALGAAAALTIVLSRRATVRRRRDRYHRQENIEVHTLTPTTELW